MPYRTKKTNTMNGIIALPTQLKNALIHHSQFMFKYLGSKPA